jgi:hypothetical protein
MEGRLPLLAEEVPLLARRVRAFHLEESPPPSSLLSTLSASGLVVLWCDFLKSRVRVGVPGRGNFGGGWVPSGPQNRNE